MKKKIFKVIGIVLASVFGFTGAVLGVMALMGKFKTPDVYPDVLVFQQNEIVVIDEYIALDEYEKSDLYSFTLTGITNNEEYADIGVNKTTCYIWFADDEQNNNVGANLITLCDADGNPLSKITDVNDKNYNRYKVDCNSPVYFKINSLLDNNGNQISSIANLDGKVLIHARHENEMVATSTPLTIWIDRIINSISLNDGENFAKTDADGNYAQFVTIGADTRKDFDYVVNPEKSRNPISAQNGKIVELYIVDPSKTDYVRLTPDKFIEGDGIENDLSEYVYNVVKYDEDNKKFYIETSLTDVTHNFKIAVFPTYQAKLDYEAKAESLTDANWQRIDNMLVTNLSVNVVNSNITDVVLDSYSVGLSLYSENDYVSLNGSSGLNDVKNNNLGLTMYKGNESTDLRYDEAKFAGYEFTSVSTDTLTFVNEKDDDDIKIGATSLVLETSNIHLGDNRVIVGKITDDENEYYCKNGVLVYNETNGEYETLKPGTYLDFYQYNTTDDEFAVMESSFDEDKQVRTYGDYFIVNRKINSKGNSSWNIIATKEISDGEDIRLGVLVINSDGTFSVENFFKTASVVVEIRDLTYSIDPNAHTLNIYHKNGVECDSMDFKDIVYELVGSYNAVVFAVPTTDNCGVEVLRKDAETPYVFTIGSGSDQKSYYIVGWFDGENFVNQVKITDTDKSEPTILQLMQFKNGYGEDVNGVIKKITNEAVATIAVDNYVNKVISTDTVTINPKQNLDAEQLNYTYSSWDETNQRVEVFEQTENHTIQISSPNANMLYKIFKFYGLDTSSGNNFNDYISSGDARVQITGVTYHEAVVIEGEPTKDAYIEITYNVTNKLISEQGVYIVISGVGSYLDAEEVEQNVVIELGPIYVNQSTPSSIAYKSGAVTIALENNETDAKASSAVLNIELSGTNYTPKLSLTDGKTSIEITDENFNTQTIKDEAGFQDADGYKVTHNVKYTSLNTNIFTINENEDGTSLTAISAGVGVLKVTIADSVDAFLKVEIKGDGNYQFKVGGGVVSAGNKTPAYYKHTYTGSAFTLDSFASLKYGTETSNLNLLSSTTDISITNAECNYYGNGLIDVDETTDGILFTTATGEETLKIYKVGSNWTFIRDTNKYVPITVTFDVVTKVGTIKIQLEITSDITAQFNEEFWQTNTIYAGTTVLVYENKTDIANFTKTALISVKTADSNNVVKIEINKEDGSNEKIIASANGVDGAEVTYQYNFANVGKYNLVVYVDNSKITSFTFNVVPNVVVTSKNIELNSNTNKDVTDYYTFHSFDVEDVDENTIIYGEKITDSTETLYNKFYSYYSYTYDGTKLTNVTLNPTENFSDLENLSVECDVKDDLDSNLVAYDATYKKLVVGWLKEVNGSRSCNITFNYKGDVINNGKFTENVKNQYTASLAVGIEENGLQTLKEYSIAGIVDGLSSAELKEVYCKTITENNLYADSKITIPAISSPITAEMEFKYELDGKELIYKTNVKINPYKPNYIVTDNEAYSVENYDLLNKMFNIADIHEDIDSLIVDGIYADANRTQLLDGVITGELNKGYNKIDATNGCTVKLNAFEGDSKTVFVGYTITYIGVAESYSFTEQLTIENRQSITLNYPEQDNDLGFEQIAFKFKEANDNDGKFLSGSDTSSAGNVYAISSNRDTDVFDDVYTANYAERILISDKPTTINFKEDSFKGVSRVLIDNRVDGDDKTPKNPIVTKIAYETQTDFDKYFNNISINLDSPWEVTLPEATEGTHGYIIFKVFTASGNYVYYYVYVFCANETGVKADSNLIVNKIVNDGTSTDIESSTCLVGEGGDAIISKADFKTKFGKEFNDASISFYITDAYELTENGYSRELDLDKYIPLNYEDLTDKLSDIKKYTTITISVLFNNDGAEVYGIGTITLIVRPTDAPTDVTGLSVNEISSTKLYNGEYTGIILNNDTSYDCPFGSSGYEIVKREQTGTVVQDAGSGNLTLSRVEENYTFTVFYKKGNLILKVTYTYFQTTYVGNTTVTGAGIGEFNTTDKVFITDYKLTSALLGNYEGEIKVGNRSVNLLNLSTTVSKTKISDRADEKVSYRVENNELYLVFELSSQAYNAVVPITFVESGKTAELTFPVKEGVYVERDNSAGKGLDSAEDNRLKTVYGIDSDEEDATLSDVTYNQAIGSTLKIAETSGYNSIKIYTIGGLTVYTCNDAYIDVKFSEVNYLTSGSTVLTNGLTSASSATLNFVHLAENKDLTMYVTITDGTNAYTTQTMYITVQKTYENLIAQYVTTDADHENVVNGNVINNIYNYLFINNPYNTSLTSVASETITNNLRVALVGYKWDADKEKFVQEIKTSGVSFNGMGFVMENNPNKPTFKFNGYTISGELDFGEYFKNVDANTPVTLYISNTAGIEDVSYNFQIVPGDASFIMVDKIKTPSPIDGVTYYTFDTGVYTVCTSLTEFVEGTDYYIDGTKLTDTITYSSDFGYVGQNYISFTEWLKTNEEGVLTSEAKELTIGTLNDGLNDKSFYLTSVNLVKGASTYSESVEPSYKDDGLTKVYTISSDSTNNPDFALELIFYGDTKLLTCKLVKGTLNDKDQLTFTISLFGTTNYIAESFKIVFTKLNVTGPATTDSVYADTYINLIDDKKINLSEGVNKEDIELVLNTTSSYYTVKGNRKDVVSSSTNLFMYNQDNKAIQLDQVGEEQVVANLVFDVEYKGIYISQAIYNFEVKRNLVVVVNGDTVKDRTLQTEFHLTKAKDADKVFPLTYSFASSLTNSNNEIEEKFSELVINLYKFTNPSSPLGLDYLTLKLSSNHSDAVYIDNDNKTITFYKDLTDYIEIEVTIESDLLNGNGTYVTTWGIDVKGIIDFDGPDTETSKDRLTVDGTTAYASSQSVELVNMAKSNETAISMTRNTTFKDIPTTGDNAQPDVEVTIEGKYVESNTTNDSLTNYQIFTKFKTDKDGNETTESYATEFDVEDNLKILGDSSKLLINLPYVPTGDQSYIVVYKVTFTYLSLGTATDTKAETFYVAYAVRNNIAIQENIFEAGSPAKTYYGGQVNMDDTNRLIADNPATATTETGAHLDLFYYAETWTDGTDNYVLTYNGSNNYSVTNSGYYNTADGKVYTAENGTACTKESSTTFYNSENKIYSVFNSLFNNIIAYKDFIDKALNGYVAISDSKNNKVYYFKLISLGSGRFGVNLKEYWGKAEDMNDNNKKKSEAFVKNELIDDLVVYVDNAPVVTLPAYNEQTQKGFKLHTQNKLIYTADAETDDTTADDYYIKDMFMDSEIGSIATGYDLNKIKEIRVLGIVPIDNASTTEVDESKPEEGLINGTKSQGVGALQPAIATISIENGSGLTTYTLHPVTYSGDTEDETIYTLEDTFYVLKTSTSEAKIAVRDYGNGSSIVSFRFRVAYTPAADGYVSLDTSKAFRLYEMKDNALTYTTPNEIDSTTGEITKTNYTPTYNRLSGEDAENNSIKIHKDKLIEYKATHPDEINYQAEYTVNIGGTQGEGDVITGGINVKVYVQFILPTSVTTVNYNATKSEVTIEVSSLNITLDTGVTITEITSANTTCDGEKIKLLATSMYDCFKDGNKLYIEELTLELSNGKDLTYYVVILDSRTLNYYTKSGVAPINSVIVNNTATFDVNNTPSNSSDNITATLWHTNGVINKVIYDDVDYTDENKDGKFTTDSRKYASYTIEFTQKIAKLTYSDGSLTEIEVDGSTYSYDSTTKTFKSSLDDYFKLNGSKLEYYLSDTSTAIETIIYEDYFILV